MKNFKITILSVLLLSGCTTALLHPRYEEYNGKDYAILQTYNFRTSFISIYKRDNTKNCLIKDGLARTLVVEDLFLPKEKSRHIDKSPFKNIDSLIEFKLEPNTYIEYEVLSNNIYVDSKKFRFFVEKGNYYSPNIVGKKYIPAINSTTTIEEMYYYPKNKEGDFIINKDKYKQAKAWDINICD